MDKKGIVWQWKFDDFNVFENFPSEDVQEFYEFIKSIYPISDEKKKFTSEQILQQFPDKNTCPPITKDFVKRRLRGLERTQEWKIKNLRAIKKALNR